MPTVRNSTSNEHTPYMSTDEGPKFNMPGNRQQLQQYSRMPIPMLQQHSVNPFAGYSKADLLPLKAPRCTNTLHYMLQRVLVSHVCCAMMGLTCDMPKAVNSAGPMLLPTAHCCREIEVIHARWAMLGVISILLGDVVDGSPFPSQPVGGRKQLRVTK